MCRVHFHLVLYAGSDGATGSIPITRFLRGRKYFYQESATQFIYKISTYGSLYFNSYVISGNDFFR